jgi:hypothetical protein
VDGVDRPVHQRGGLKEREEILEALRCHPFG